MARSCLKLPDNDLVLRMIRAPGSLKKLESILAERVKQSRALGDENDLFFGHPINPHPFRNDHKYDLFPPVKEWVDGFLGVSIEPGPFVIGFQIRSSYDNDRIEIQPSRPVLAHGDLSHEYTHHVQHKVFWIRNFKRYSDVFEGHARGVQRQLGEAFSGQTSNQAYRWDPLQYDLAELKSVYMWLCGWSNTSPKKALSGVPSKYCLLYTSPSPRD